MYVKDALLMISLASNNTVYCSSKSLYKTKRLQKDREGYLQSYTFTLSTLGSHPTVLPLCPTLESHPRVPL